MTTGEIIKRLLEERNIKQSELARYLGVSSNTVWRWIPSDKSVSKVVHEPDYYYKCRIADFFQVPVECITGEDDYWDGNLQPMVDRWEKRVAWHKLLTLMGYVIEYGDDYAPLKPMEKTEDILITNGKIRKKIHHGEFNRLLDNFERHIELAIEIL